MNAIDTFREKIPAEVFCCGYYEISKNIYFEEHLRTRCLTFSIPPQNKNFKQFFESLMNASRIIFKPWVFNGRQTLNPFL